MSQCTVGRVVPGCCVKVVQSGLLKDRNDSLSADGVDWFSPINTRIPSLESAFVTYERKPD